MVSTSTIAAIPVALFSVAALFLYTYITQNPSIVPTATSHGYTTQILSISPMMIYLEDFLQQSEIAHLLELGESLYAPSLIYDTSNPSVNPNAPSAKSQPGTAPGRTSTSCFLPNNDTVVSTIRSRVSSFLGFLPFSDVEALQLVRYTPGQKFSLHYDWFPEPKLDSEGRKYNRLASFFLYLQDECLGGETYFPKLRRPAGLISRGKSNLVGDAGRQVGEQEGEEEENEWDDKFLIPTEKRKGLGVVPAVGNGVFWMNLKEDMTGDEKTLHAGLPVEDGVKVGMNIWITRFVDEAV